MNYFDPNPEMEAAIDAKIEAALLGGVDLEGPDKLVLAGITQEEMRYMAEREIGRIVSVNLGEHVFKTLRTNGCRLVRNDIIPCLTAYFEAVDAGEVEAA